MKFQLPHSFTFSFLSAINRFFAFLKVLIFLLIIVNLFSSAQKIDKINAGASYLLEHNRTSEIRIIPPVPIQFNAFDDLKATAGKYKNNNICLIKSRSQSAFNAIGFVIISFFPTYIAAESVTKSGSKQKKYITTNK